MSNQAMRGFTLVELIVSMGLFAFVMSISMGAYLIMIAANREAQATTTGINNLSYALESITRDIRTCKDYDLLCDSTPKNDFTFTRFDQNRDATPVTFGLKNNRLIEKEGTNGEEIFITDPLVTVTKLNFLCSGVLRGEGDDTRVQANVTIVLEGTVSAGPNKTRTFNVQTTSTMRGIDL